MFVLLSQPMQISTMSCAKYMREQKKQNSTVSRPAIFPTTPGNCAVLSVTVREASALTCSFCRMWISPARNAGEHGMEKKRGWFTIRIKTGEQYTLPDLMAMDVHTARKVCRDMRLVHHACGCWRIWAWDILHSVRKHRACPAGRHSV